MGSVAQATHGALLLIFYVAGPILGVILAIGIVISVLLAVTQINEPTLSFVPKFFGTALALALLGPWLLRQLEGFAVAILTGLPGMLS
jgi:flagellar biosynthetic protein FliQ